MGYYTRVFCTKASCPGLQELLDWAKQRGHDITVEDQSQSDLTVDDWQQYAIIYKEGKLPILVECNRQGQDDLFNDEIDEFLERIGKPGLSLAKRKVIKHLQNAKFIISCQLPTSDIDNDGHDANCEIMNFFIENFDGMAQADDEGFYEKNKLVLKA